MRMPTWHVIVAGHRMRVSARDIDAARTVAIYTAIRQYSIPLRHAFTTTSVPQMVGL